MTATSPAAAVIRFLHCCSILFLALAELRAPRRACAQPPSPLPNRRLQLNAVQATRPTGNASFVRFQLGQHAIRGISFARQRSRLACIDASYGVYVIDTADGVETLPVPGYPSDHFDPSYGFDGCVSIAGSGELVAAGISGLPKSHVFVWDVDSRSVKRSGHVSHIPTGITFSTSNRRLAVGCRTGSSPWFYNGSTVVFCSLEGDLNVPGRLNFGQDNPRAVHEEPGRIKDFSQVEAVAFSNDGKLLASGGSFGELWHRIGAKAGITGHAAAYEVDGFPEGLVRIWDVASGRLVREFAIPKTRNGVQCLQFSSDANELCCVDDRVRRLDIMKNEQRELRGPIIEPSSLVCVSADSLRIATWTKDGVLSIRDAQSGEVTGKLVVGADPAKAIALSHDGGAVAIGTVRGDVKVYNGIGRIGQ